MASKRPHVSTGDTPHKEKQPRETPLNEPERSRRALFQDDSSNNKVKYGYLQVIIGGDLVYTACPHQCASVNLRYKYCKYFS